MPCHLPPEMLDHVADQMRDDPTALKTCCLVSKSWIQRTQKHLFAQIGFYASCPSVESWKNAFPDPMHSPAHHTRSISIRHPHLITASDVDTILTFCNVERLDVITVGCPDARISLAPLHGLFPILRSLYLSFISLPDSEIFALICSFPLLQDLTLVSLGRGHRDEQWTAPPTHLDSTGPSRLRLCSKESGPSPIDCWTSRTASTSQRSRCHGSPKKTSGLRWIWWRGAPIPSDPSTLRITAQVRFPHFFPYPIDNSRTHRRFRDDWNRPLPSGKPPGCGI